MNVPLVPDRRIYTSLHIPPASHTPPASYTPPVSHTMAKRKDVPADANVLDMRHFKRSRLRGNAPASSDVAVAVPGIPLASQSISDIPLDAVPKHQRVALMTYSVELRQAILINRMIRSLRNA